MKGLNVEHRTASVHHAQTNGQVEAANKIVMDGLKKRVFALKGKWLEELENVLWAVRTTPKQSTGETPYGLVYGIEAVTSVEIAVASHRARYYEPMMNDEARRLELDMLEEKRRKSDKV